jgi:hypothetical protein
MIPANENVRTMLGMTSEGIGTLKHWYTASVVRGEETLLPEVRLSGTDLSWKDSDAVECSGKTSVIWHSEDGSSINPTTPSGILAPFGSRLLIYSNLQVDPEVIESIQIADLNITDVIDGRDSRAIWDNKPIALGSIVPLNISDRMVEVQRDRILKLTTPTFMDSVYQEMQDLTGFAMTRTVPDQTVRKATVYDEDRFKVLEQLAQILDAVPFMEYDGTLSVRPNVLASTEPVWELKVGPQGNIDEISSSLSADEIYNGVVIRTEGADQGNILAEKWIEQGPLAATMDGGERTPFHRVPRFYSNPQITTKDQARKVIDSLLETFTRPQNAELEIRCLFNPLVQVGDVVSVWDGTSRRNIRLSSKRMSESAYMNVVGTVV